MNIIKYKTIWGLLFMVVVLIACTPDDPKPEPEIDPSTLPLSEELATVTVDEIQRLLGLYPLISEAFASEELHAVKAYRILYNTTNVEGESIIASGAVLIPQLDGKVPLVSYQHGTLTEKEDAPSNFSTGFEVRFTGPITASAGYVVSMPDYIGYGETSDLWHPYEHANTLATASYDMLMAVKNLFGEQISESLFLAGYSEGGYATMALHKYIEEETSLKVTLSAPGAGAYNKTAFVKEILSETEIAQNYLPNYMWVIHSYNWIYKMNRKWSDFVTSGNDTILNEIAPLDTTTGYPNHLEEAVFPNLFADTLFLEEFRMSVIDDSEDAILDQEFLDALADNDIYNWAPKAPVRMFHGLADDYVYVLNSNTANDYMSAQVVEVDGAVREVDVSLTLLSGTHSTAAIPYFVEVYKLFKEAMSPVESMVE